MNHEHYIQRCIRIATNGLGSTRPNPAVGAVIVYNDIIIGEGYTSAYGGSHAEVNAINAVVDEQLLKQATLYVTLEPCSHYGKTPPCSDLIIKHKIPNVVIGCIDDNPEVAGRGIKKLRAAGCNVTVGVMENECKTHHKRFFTFHNKKRPYIILKWAESADGFIAPVTKEDKKPVWITNVYSRQLVHKWRAQEQAILVGTNTVIKDNPSLTTRDWTGQNPIRLVIDRDLKLTKDHKIFDNAAQTFVFTEQTHSSNAVNILSLDFTQPLAQQICNALYGEMIQSIIIEGGAKTLQTFINENLWDEAQIFTGPILFKNGIKAPEFTGNQTENTIILNDHLKIYKNC